jgi:hypothetical protein
MGRHGTVAELGNLRVLLMSDGCDYLTGATIPVDGGQRLAGRSTFAGLASLGDDEWAAVQERSMAARADRVGDG